MEPELVVRLANWFKLQATNNNITVPTANASQPRFPVFENISGTMSAAVMVGEMRAMFCASSSTKFRQFVRSLVSVLMVCPFVQGWDSIWRVWGRWRIGGIWGT